jgi:hypothetical protein
MKKLLASIIILLVSINMICAQTAKPATKGNLRTWAITISPQTKKQYLDSVITAWNKDSIVLSFSKLDYNAAGKLVKVKGSVNVTSRGHHASGTFAPEKDLVSVEIKVTDGPGVSIEVK